MKKLDRDLNHLSVLVVCLFVCFLASSLVHVPDAAVLFGGIIKSFYASRAVVRMAEKTKGDNRCVCVCGRVCVRVWGEGGVSMRACLRVRACVRARARARVCGCVCSV